MPIPFLAMAGAQLIGSGINAFSQANAAKRNRRAQEERQRMIDGGAATNAMGINEGLGASAGLLQQLAQTPYGSQRAQVSGYNFDPVSGQQVEVGQRTAFQSNANGLGADNVDIGQLFSGNDAQGFNVGQDSLMQFLRADPITQQEGTNGVLEEIAATGLPADMSSLFAAANQVNSANNADILSQVTGRAGSVGQRFGSATQRIAGETGRRLASEQSLQNSQLALNAAESASGRRLSAASQLGQFQLQNAGQQGQLALQQRQMQLQGAGQLGQLELQRMGQSTQSDQFGRGQTLQAMLANQQNQQFGANMGQQNSQFNASASNQMQAQNLNAALQTALANQASGNRANEFNASTGFAVNQGNNSQLLQALFGNNQQTLAERGQQMGGLQGAAQAQQQRSALLNQLLGIRSGVQTPQSQSTNPGNGFGDLASLMAGFNRYGSGLAPSMVDPYPQQMNPIRGSR